MKNIHYIPHTHWDREWYRSSDAFRIRLTYSFDMLLDILDNNDEYKYFTFDGQVGALEDYLQIRPENREKISKYIKEKRIFVGPWYIQPDLFLVSGESVLRNLLIGSNIAEDLGHSMQVGWIPDAFGQIQTTPQIFKELGLKSLFVWRGFDYKKTNDSVFLWEAPNEDKILTVHFPLGYGHYRYLPTCKEQAYKDIKDVVDKVEDRFIDNQILFMGGSDHARPQGNITEILKSIEDRFLNEEYNIKISNPEEFVKDVNEDIKNSKRELEIYKGEARSADLGRIHAGITSTRIDIKNEMKKFETLLPLVVEPMSVINNIFGGNYDQSITNYFWKMLFKNQFHDSIYSSSPETVNLTAFNRLNNLRHGINELIWLNFRFLKDNIDYTTLSDDEEPLVLFNTLPYKRNDLVFVNLYVKDENFILKDMKNNIVPFVKLEELEEINNEIEFYNGLLNLNDIAEVKEKTMKQVQIKLLGDVVPEMGYKVFKVCYKEKSNIEIKTSLNLINDREFENEFIKVKINENGTLNIQNKENQVIYDDLHWFEEKGDDGDEYNYSMPIEDKIIDTRNLKPSIKLVLNNPYEIKYRIKYEILTPYQCIDHKRDNENVKSYIISEISLKEKSKTIDFKTTIDNKANDHMIRAIFKDVEQSETNISEDHFGTVVRSNRILSQKGLENGATELELPIYPMQRFVKLNDTKNTFAVLTSGPCEYEIYENNKIAITLIRCIGKFGKADLKIRPGRASGYRLDCEESQLMKKVTSSYSLYIDCGKLNVNKVSKEASMLNVKIQSRHLKSFTKNSNAKMPFEFSLLKLNSDLKVMTLKKTEDKSAYIIRILNANNCNLKDITFYIDKVYKKAYLSNLKEERISQLKIKENNVLIPEIKKESFVSIILEC